MESDSLELRCNSVKGWVETPDVVVRPSDGAACVFARIPDGSHVLMRGCVDESFRLLEIILEYIHRFHLLKFGMFAFDCLDSL